MKASSKPRSLPALRAVLLALPALWLAACGNTPTKPEPPAKSGQPTPPAQVPDKGDPQARFDAALELMKNGDAAGAEQGLTALTKDFPEFSGPWTNLGILYAKSKRRDAAINAFTRAANQNPGNAVAFNWLGILNREAGNYERAKLAYEKALSLDPNDNLARLNYAILLDQYLKQPQAALVQYKQYQAQNPKEDLRVMAWVAEIEAKNKPATPPAATPAAAPAAPAGAVLA
ncbi:MAG: tetratricopeptide repeat protein, partial [Solimonas sp.]